MLRIWNVSLVLATGVLAILGTFLVRSGMLNSIHAFGASTLGVPFLLLIATMIAGSISLVATRAEALRSEHRLDSLLSREAVFLLNNLVLVALCFVVFWGTFFPLIAEAVTGEPAQHRAAGVRALRRAAGADARAAAGDRAADRLAADDAREPAPEPRRARLRPASPCWSRCSRSGVTRLGTALLMFALAALRRRRRRAGVLARRARAARDVARGRCRSRWSRWSAQPAPLRRLPRARRDRVLFVGVAASSSVQARRGRPAARRGQTAQVGDYDVHLRQADRRELYAASNGRLERIDLGAAAAGRASGGRVTTRSDVQGLLPDRWTRAGAGLALLRGRVDDRGRARRRPAQRRLGRHRAGHRQARSRASTRATRCSQGRRCLRSTRVATQFLALALKGLTDRYADNPPPATLPLRGQPARHLDLARRA